MVDQEAWLFLGRGEGRLRPEAGGTAVKRCAVPGALLVDVIEPEFCEHSARTLA